jgi:hypothetical protein
MEKCKYTGRDIDTDKAQTERPATEAQEERIKSSQDLSNLAWSRNGMRGLGLQKVKGKEEETLMGTETWGGRRKWW